MLYVNIISNKLFYQVYICIYCYTFKYLNIGYFNYKKQSTYLRMNEQSLT